MPNFGYLRGDQVLMKVVQYLAESVLNSQFCSGGHDVRSFCFAPGVPHDELRRKVQTILLHKIYNDARVGGTQRAGTNNAGRPHAVGAG